MKCRYLSPRILAAVIAACFAAGDGVQNLWAGPALPTTPSNQSTAASGKQRYIVRFVEPALAMYNRSLRTAHANGGGAAGRVNGIGPIPMRAASSGRVHLDAKSTQAKAYLATLATRQLEHQKEIQTALGRNTPFLRTYRHALNAAVMELTTVEAEQMRKLAGVAVVVPDRAHALADDISTRFIGANAVWLGGIGIDNNPGYTFPTLQSLFGELTGWGFKGDGIVVGDIDTGYNSLSPSFQATDASGYRISNPLGSGTYLGDCNVDGISLGGCNDKVIGVYDEVSEQYYGDSPQSVEDTQGHGSHTASTAAGNARQGGFPGFTANLSGIAPHANLVIFYACAPAPVNCQDSATAGSVDQAVEDGVVDVLNFSISGGQRPWNDPVSQAFLAAEEAGIFTAAAAGNTGTGVPEAVPGTVNHLEPWVTTVAATSPPGAALSPVLSLSGPGSPPASVQNLALTEGTYDKPLVSALPASTPIVLSPQFHIGDTDGSDGCSSLGNDYAHGTFTGAIALISRGTCAFAEKASAAVAAGAIAVVISDNRAEGALSPTVGPPQIGVPVFSISQDSGAAAQSFLAAHAGRGSAALGSPSERPAQKADVLGDFSLIGPADIEVIKPDVAAPGVGVLAAVANDGSVSGADLVAFYDGTSMATPHITGTAALVAGLHPDWSPMEIKSAIMMTAREAGTTKPDAVTPADFYDRGAGRVQAFDATRAGLVLDESATNMWYAYPDAGGDLTSLNLASLQNSSCAMHCSFVRTLRATQAASWSVQVGGELAGKIVVSPAQFTVAAGDQITLDIELDTSNLAALSGYHFGDIVLTARATDDVFPQFSYLPSLHLPVAVSVPAPQLQLAAQSVDISLDAQGSGTGSVDVSNLGTGQLLFRPQTGGRLPFTWISQVSGDYYGFYSTHYLGLGSGDSDFYVADDFEITGTDPVDLTSIVTPGFTSNHTLASFGKSLGLHWRIYADASGLPGADPDDGTSAAWSFDATAGSAGVSVAGDTISLNLVAAHAATALPAGHYWLVVYPDLPCNDKNGSGCIEGWAWLNSWKGSAALWATTAPQLGGGWDNTPDYNAPYGLGLAMTISSNADCSMPSWLSMLPAVGEVGPASSTPVTFKADFSSGNPTPPQTAYVCLASSWESELGLEYPLSVTPMQVSAH